MGQKINPIIYRTSFKKNWRSSFYSPSPYYKSLNLDIRIRKYIYNIFTNLSISADLILIKKYPLLNTIYITSQISSNLSSVNLEGMKEHLKVLTGYKIIHIDLCEVDVNVIPLNNAELLSKYIAKLIEMRSKFGMKKILISLKEVEELKGYKIRISGRLNGVEMARHKIYRRGLLPLQSINSSIDYAYNIAYTKYGIIGVKVWLYHNS